MVLLLVNQKEKSLYQHKMHENNFFGRTHEKRRKYSGYIMIFFLLTILGKFCSADSEISQFFSHPPLKIFQNSTSTLNNALLSYLREVWFDL
jgi:hypothetical protein